MSVSTIAVDVKEFECPICLDYFVDPVVLKKCQHAFCEACIITKECGVCREPITQKKFVVDRYRKNKAEELRQIAEQALKPNEPEKIPDALNTRPIPPPKQPTYFSKQARELFLELNLVKDEAELAVLEEVSQSKKISTIDSEAIVIKFLTETAHDMQTLKNDNMQMIFCAMRNFLKVKGYQSPYLILESYFVSLRKIDFSKGEIASVNNLHTYDVCKELLVDKPDSIYTDVVLSCLSLFVKHPDFPMDSLKEYLELVSRRCQSPRLQHQCYMNLLLTKKGDEDFQERVVETSCGLKLHEWDLDLLAKVLESYPPDSPIVCELTDTLLELIKKNHSYDHNAITAYAMKVLADWVFTPIKGRPFIFSMTRKHILDRLFELAKSSPPLKMLDGICQSLFSRLQQMLPTTPGFASLFQAYQNLLDDDTVYIDIRVKLAEMMPIGAHEGTTISSAMLFYFMLEKIHPPTCHEWLVPIFIRKMVQSMRYIPTFYGISSFEQFLALEPIQKNPDYQAILKKEWKERY